MQYIQIPAPQPPHPNPLPREREFILPFSLGRMPITIGRGMRGLLNLYFRQRFFYKYVMPAASRLSGFNLSLLRG
jgi:hypothetical protein